MKKNKRGFTLAELLIVVAIIAVLVLVSIPILMSNLDDTKATVCLANQTSLKHTLNVQLLSGATEDEMRTFARDNADEFPCPEGGSYALDINGDIITINCSIHGTSNTAGLLWNALKTLLDDGTITWNNVTWRVDSYTKTGTRTAAIKSYLEAAGISLDVENWALLRTKDDSGEEVIEVLWSTYDTPIGTSYTSVPAISYNTVTGTYTVGMASVTKTTLWEGFTPDNYNILAKGAETQGFSSVSGTQTFTSESAAKKAYAQLLPS